MGGRRTGGEEAATDDHRKRDDVRVTLQGHGRRRGQRRKTTQLVYLSTSESEESLSSDLGAEEEGVGQGGVSGRGKVNHAKERQRGYWQWVYIEGGTQERL